MCFLVKIMLATSGVGVGVNIVMGCSLHQHGHTHGGIPPFLFNTSILRPKSKNLSRGSNMGSLFSLFI